MRFILFILGILLFNDVSFADSSLSVANIPDSLIKSANAVVRFYNTSYTRVSAEKYIERKHYAITILNRGGEDEAELDIYYDRNSSITSISGLFYDKNGNLVSKLKNKEIKDYAINESYTLFSDFRVKTFNPTEDNYPYTVEYEYSIVYDGVVGFDRWTPQMGYDISVERADLTFETSEDYDIRYKELNSNFNNTKTGDGKRKTYYWSVKGLKAIKYEPDAPPYLEILPCVLLSPNEIVYEGTKGDFSTWQSYGKWVYGLIQNRDELPLETVQHVRQLTDTISSPKDKIRAVYEYMQGRTRYVNIALGIGGFQPMLAKDVDEKGYGDCKGLSNYTKSLLNAIGIQAYYTEIGTGKNREIKYKDFASANQTNHIVVCVPLKSDTVWLECTSQNMPFNRLGNGSLDRYALMVKPEGGVLVKTPSYNAEQNSRVSKIKIDLSESGDATFSLNTEFNYALYEEVFGYLHYYSSKEQEEKLLEEFEKSHDLDIDNFSFIEASRSSPKGYLNLTGKIKSFSSKAGERVFFTPEFFHDKEHSDLLKKDRKQDFFVPINYSYIDTLEITIPDYYQLEYVLDDLNIDTEYGRYVVNVEKNFGSILIYRNITFYKGRYPQNSFEDINNFLKKIDAFENKKMVVKAKT